MRLGTSPQEKLARKIAVTVREQVEARTPIGRDRGRCALAMCWCWCASADRCSRPIIRALKNAGVAVAGADRLVLTEHIAVVDLHGAGRCAAAAEDDLALAVALKSPLFGFDDARCSPRLGRRGSLRAALAERAWRGAWISRGAMRCCGAARCGAPRTPFEFFAWLLGPERGRKKIFARGSGLEAADALDEFLELALDYERVKPPRCKDFWRGCGPPRPSIKRDMDTRRRSAGHDGAWRQGPRGAGGDSRRHHDAAARSLAAAAPRSCRHGPPGWRRRACRARSPGRAARATRPPSRRRAGAVAEVSTNTAACSMWR